MNNDIGSLPIPKIKLISQPIGRGGREARRQEEEESEKGRKEGQETEGEGLDPRPHDRVLVRGAGS